MRLGGQAYRSTGFGEPRDLNLDDAVRLIHVIDHVSFSFNLNPATSDIGIFDCLKKTCSSIGIIYLIFYYYYRKYKLFY